MAESFGTGEPGNEMMARLTPVFDKGQYLPPDKPGIGADLPPAVIKKYLPSLAD
jgi:L-alanine-DL-glutamate epimerase-like enolase superfamily enzyme